MVEGRTPQNIGAQHCFYKRGKNDKNVRAFLRQSLRRDGLGVRGEVSLEDRAAQGRRPRAQQMQQFFAKSPKKKKKRLWFLLRSKLSQRS